MSADAIVYCLEHLTDYPQFERLCSDIMNQSGYRNIEPLGGSNDRGRDALHISRTDQNDITIFAYSVRNDWLQKLINEDCKRIREEGHAIRRLAFVCTASITSSQRDAAVQRVLNEFGWSLELYDIERLRIRLATDLQPLIAQHSAIFCPPFFPSRGGLSISECRDTLVIDHVASDHALATWLARRLQLAGYRTWCYGTAPLAGETADDSIRVLIEKRALRFLPLLSPESTTNADFLGRTATACGLEGLVLPCVAKLCDVARFPTKLGALVAVPFTDGLAAGLKSLLASLDATAVAPALSGEQGKAIAIRSYVPQPVTRVTPEMVYANTFAARVPHAIQVCHLAREISDDEKSQLRTLWGFCEADFRTLLSFEDPPQIVPLEGDGRLPEYSWKHYEFKHGRRSIDVVKELVWRSLDVVSARAGLEWCDDRHVFYFTNDNNPQRNISFVHVDGRRTRVAVTGEKSYGSGDRAIPFRYQLAPRFRVGRDEAGDWWVTLRIYVRITDRKGVPYEKKAITQRRKKVAKSWWNKEWFARTLGIMQALSQEKEEIVIGSGSRQLAVSTTPLSWECPVSIDYHTVEMVGDFQEEMAALRYLADEDDDLDGESGDVVDGR